MAIGSTLQIPEKLLEQMKKVDSELDTMTKKAEKAGSALDNAFRNVASGSLTGVINLLQTLNKELANTSSVAGSLGGSMRQAGSESTTALSNTTRQAKETTRGITDLASAVERYTEFLELAAKGGASLGSVKTTIKEITSLLNSPTQAGNGDTQALMEAQQRLTTIRAQLKAMSNVMNANVSPTAALQYAESAASVNERTQAIKLLTAARNSLRTTDEGYTQTLNTLNAKIKEMNAANKQVIAGSKEVATTHRNLMDISGQLARKLALVFSVSQLTGYFRMLINVRGEFELAQRSLESMLGNMSKADAIFQKTVELAVRSPFTVRQLVSYTKQLSAYRIETDKLYDTTKRLADVSAGLGVDMQRIILAYGQVKAAAYLRGTEVRQFTEAGVNIYGELRDYFKETQGIEYTTGDIVSLISRRGVTFSDVEAVFQRLTDEGGMFYNMQEVQAETLKGKVSNLHDAVDIMLNDIGKSNDSLLKGLITGITNITRNWQSFAAILVASVSSIAAFKAIMFASTKLIPVLKRGWQDIGKIIAALKAGNGFGGAFGATSATTWAGVTAVALGGIITLFGTLNNLAEEYKTKIKEATDAFAEQLLTLARLTDAFAEAEGIGNKQNVFDKLIDTAQKAGLTFDESITEGITDENLQERFNKAAAMYDDFTSKLYKIRGDAANSGGLFSDDINEDMKDYGDAAREMVGAYESAREYAAVLLHERQNLTDEEKESLGIIIKGTDNVNERLEFMINAAQTLTRINPVLVESERLVEGGVEATMSHLNTVLTQNASDAAGNFYDVFSATFDDLAADESLTIEQKSNIAKGLIDAVGAEWNDFSRYLAYQLANNKYYWNIQIDMGDVEEQLGSVEQFINAWLEEHEFTIHFSGGSLRMSGIEDVLTEIRKEIPSGYSELVENLKMVENATEDVFTKDLVENTLGKSWDSLVQDVYGIGADSDKIETIERSQMAELLQNRKDEMEEAAAKMGVALSKGGEAKQAKKTNDVWSQRISLLEKAADRYEKLRKLMSDENAQAKTLAAFTPALITAGLSPEVVAGFVPTKEGLKNTLASLLDGINDAKRKSDVQGKIAELEIEIDEEKLDKELETAKKKIESAFSGLELFQELLDAGLSEWQIKGMLPDLASSFSDVEGVIEEQLGGKEGTEAEEEYKEQKAKLSEKVNKQAVEDMKEIVKNYGEQLSDQLQLDIWYQKEKAKIGKNSYLDQDLEDTALKNLGIQYNEKTAENTWKQFQMSDFYLRIFDDVESMSMRMLDAMLNKLRSLKEEMKNLDPSQLEDVTKAMNEIEEELGTRNPFKTFTSNIGSFISDIGKRNELEKKYLGFLQEESSLQEDERKVNLQINDAENAFGRAMAGGDEGEIDEADANLKKLREELERIKKLLKENKEDIDETEETLENMSETANKVYNSLSELAGQLQAMQGAVSDFGEAWTVLGYETPEIVENLSSALGYGAEFAEAGQAMLEAWNTGNYVGAITSGVSALSSAVSAVGSIFGFGNHDSKLQEKIEALQREIDSLDHTIEKLQETFDDAWSAVNLINTKDETIEAMEQQIEDYEAMIKAEKDKKDTDEDQIQEWEEAIEDLEDDIEDLEEDFIEALGGFGSEANYKSAAEDFSDAWVEAFRESEDTLEALEDTFDDYFYNLISKQITNRAAEEYIRPILEAFDAAVAEDSDEGVYVTDEELAELQALKEENLEAYDEYLRALMEVLGVEADASTDSSLSQLQQGIESISEETGAALESLLNSIRFYVAQQTTDVIAIRNLLEAQYGSTTSSSSSSTLVLAELQSQTALIKNISSILSSVTMSGWKNGGKGIKVFMD